MSDSATSLIPTSVDGEGYGAKPEGAPRVKKEKGSTGRTRVVASVASASAVLGALAFVASGQTPLYSAPLGADEARAITFDAVLAKQGHSMASLKKSRLEGIELLSKMSIQPRINTPHASTTAHFW